jgi:hypothetical protein
MPIEAACHLACYHLVQAFLRKTEPSNAQPWIHIYTYTNTHIYACHLLNISTLIATVMSDVWKENMGFGANQSEWN